MSRAVGTSLGTGNEPSESQYADVNGSVVSMNRSAVVVVSVMSEGHTAALEAGCHNR